MRYKLMGHQTVQREDNRQLLSSQQRSVPEVEVYETNDRDEALAIKRAGGFLRGDTWIAVVRAVDTEQEGAPSKPADANPAQEVRSSALQKPLGADLPGVPNNSSAEIDRAGRVKTDPHKKPMTQADVVEQAETGLNPDLPRRKIIP